MRKGPWMIRALFLLAVLSAAAASPAAAFDVRAGKMRYEEEAVGVCPRLCEHYGGWEREWKRLLGGKAICRCAEGPVGKKNEANGGPLAESEARAAWACVRACTHYGGWDQAWRAVDGQIACRCKQALTSSRSDQP